MHKWTLKQLGSNVFELCFWDIGQDTAWMLLRSDVHHDNPKCDQDLERKHLNEALESNCPALDNGDLFCAMQGKYDRRSSKESIRPEHQTNNYLDSLVSTAVEFYQPYKSILAICGRGNHETAIQKNHETDLTDRLTAGLRSVGGVTLSSGYSGWVRLSVKSSANPDRYVASAWLHHYHGSGGGGPVTKGVIQTNRIANYTPDANVVLTGHTHDDWIFSIPRQRISQNGKVYRDEQLHVRCPGYKDAWGDGSGGWEVERGMGPKNIGSAWLGITVSRTKGGSDRLNLEAMRAK
jgi:hypothetical protein